MRKILYRLKTALAWGIMVLAVCVMVFTFLSVFVLNKENAALLGYRGYVVLSDSMSATDFDAGDVVWVKAKIDPDTLKEGDIIAYISQAPDHFGETVTHKIRKRTVDSKGEPGFITYGTSNDMDDQGVVTYPFIRGQYRGRIPKIGFLFQFFRTIPGYIVFVLLPFLLLITSSIQMCVRDIRDYRSEVLREKQGRLGEERTEPERREKELEEKKPCSQRET